MLNPAQMEVAPERLAVGDVLTVTIGVTVMEVPVQFTSLTAVMLYVLVEAGLTLKT